MKNEENIDNKQWKTHFVIQKSYPLLFKLYKYTPNFKFVRNHCLLIMWYFSLTSNECPLHGEWLLSRDSLDFEPSNAACHGHASLGSRSQAIWWCSTSPLLLYIWLSLGPQNVITERYFGKSIDWYKHTRSNRQSYKQFLLKKYNQIALQEIPKELHA